MRTTPFPASQLPTTTRLYADYLRGEQKIRAYYSSRAMDALKVNNSSIPLTSVEMSRHEDVAAILMRQNEKWGAGAATLQNLARLQDGASCIVTGQQAVLFGGPLYSFYKAISAIKVARELSEAGTPTVPIFWIATTDHDLAEAATAHFNVGDGLKSITHLPVGNEHSPVGSVGLGKEIGQCVQEAREYVSGEVGAELAHCYKPGVTFGEAFARFMTNVFSDSGLIFLDPSDPELNALAGPVYKNAIEQHGQLISALLKRNQELVAAGYHAQVLVEQDSALLFRVRDGERWPVNAANGGFKVEGKTYSVAEIIKQFEDGKDQFNASALLRPVIQDHLLPTRAYVGGPAEIAYFAQSSVLYEKLLGRVTPVLPRLTATLVEPDVERKLTRYGLSVPDVWVPEEALKSEIAKRALPAGLKDSFTASRTKIDSMLATLLPELQKLDPTLAGAGETAGRKMRHQVERLQSRASAAQARKESDIARQSARLHSALFPHKHLQERMISGVQMVDRHGRGLLHDLEREIPVNSADHHIIHL